MNTKKYYKVTTPGKNCFYYSRIEWNMAWLAIFCLGIMAGICIVQIIN